MSSGLAPGRCPVCPPGTPARPIARGRDFEYQTTPLEFTMQECSGCGAEFLNPRPADDAIAALYPETYEPYRFDELPAAVRRARDWVQGSKVQAVARYAGPGSRILDLGCGGGALLRLLRRRGDRSWQLTGWDYPGPHVARLAAEGFEVIEAPIVMTQARPSSADCVIMNQVIEHFAAPDQVLRLVRRVLHPGGVVFIETPDTGGLDARLFQKRYWGGYHFPRHLVLFNQESLCRLLRKEGFSVLVTEHLASPAFWVQSFHHALDESGWHAAARLFTLKNPLALAAATAVDMVAGRIGPTSNLRVVARVA